MRAANLSDEIENQIRREAWRVKRATPGEPDPPACATEKLPPVASGGTTRLPVSERHPESAGSDVLGFAEAIGTGAASSEAQQVGIQVICASGQWQLPAPQQQALGAASPPRAGEAAPTTPSSSAVTSTHLLSVVDKRPSCDETRIPYPNNIH